ncbi:sigma factor-like helix-turn-helix DNA-binding protein [Nocardiopsis dassonvillei]|uniref:sigma factor-like helix-turn-helix DNA-binding protein n=1 Tax=Nocardiopsis dassonvillei TaxID=2014 RepID=UPI00366F6201
MTNLEQLVLLDSLEWIPTVWRDVLDERARDMLVRRCADETLEGIGRHHDVTRERARQIIKNAVRALTTMADRVQPNWRDMALETLGDSLAMPDQELNDVLVDSTGVARYFLLREAGILHPRTWAGELRGFWTRDPQALDARFKELAQAGPYRSDELGSRADELGIPSAVPVERIAAHPNSRLKRSGDGAWIRRAARGRDPAYLWLADEGEPRRVEAIAAGTGGKARALAEAMRRDDRFRQIRPEGTWALAEWPFAGIHSYSNAVEVMVGILAELGPLDKATLFAEVTRRYPVSHARLQQCLISDAIGTTPSGDLDLVERGARPFEEEEPRHPDNVAVDDSGNVLGVKLMVNEEMLRGSGVIVHPWVTWRLGLRRAPMSQTFHFTDGTGALTVRRSTSAAQFSSLRSRVLGLGMEVRCWLVVILRLDSGSVTLRHVCDRGSCPASR